MALQIPDQAIALQTRAPDAMQSIAGMLNIAGGAQSLKKAQATYASDVAQRASEASLADSSAQVARANVQPLIDQQAANTQQAQTQSAAARFKLTGDQLEKSMQIGQGLLADPAISSGDMTKIVPLVAAARQRMIDSGIPSDTAEVQAAHLLTAAAHDPASLPQLLKNSMLQSMPAQQQVDAITPKLVQASNGQQISFSNVNPLAEGGVGAQPIAPIQQQLPPTTPTMENGTPGYLGPQPAQQQNMGFDPSRLTPQQKAAMIQNDPVAYANGLESFYQRGQQPQAQRVVSGMPVGASEGIQGTQGVINDDWKTSVNSANGAQRTIGILQNIKQYATGAATGVHADKQAYLSGLAGLLGMDAGELARTNTDLLAKNSNMLALAGGNTDAARAMAEAANPNSHMTREALTHAADQLIGQQQLNLARVKYLMPFKAQADAGHPEMYNAALNEFNSVADPRVIQFSSMSPEEKIAMKSSMSEKERAQFGAKLGKARTLGVAP